MSFVHLHVHSEYSLLDGFSNIQKLVARAKEMGMPAVALTDHGTMFGVIEFFNAAKKAGVKPIVGVEAYLAPRGMNSRDPQIDKKSTHLLLLAENQTGYGNLLKLASLAQLSGFYYYPRVDHETLSAHSEGLICTSGCMSAEVPRLISNGDFEGARRQLDWYYNVFGKDRFFLELQQHDIPDLDRINRHLVDLGRRYDAKFVATNDVHYINKDDARLQDIMLAIQTGCLLSDPNRMRMTDDSYYLRSPEEMSRIFAEVPEAISNTLLIAERCSVDLGFKGYHMPEFPLPPGTNAKDFLSELCHRGLDRRYGARANNPDVQHRLNYELDVIHKMGFDTYFLIVWDLCTFARSQGIWYNARGSAAGSIVAYTLDITLVDPIEYGLIFERFLNPGRISMPDIDLDFRDDRRSEMLEYTARKYGDDKVAQIITFGTLGARASIRDVGRVMDIPLPDVDRVAKMVPNIPGKPVTIDQALEEVTEFKQAYNSAPYIKELIDNARQVEGVVRNAGTHAAGVIITDQPIIDYIPLHRPTGNAAGESPIKTVTQFELNVLDSLGLLKVDFLGLDTLTIMARACNLIDSRHGVKFTLDNIPTDDPAVYELLGRGETAGVFQLEGSGMRRWLVEMKPTELKHVIAMVALFRPGPMDFIPGYIRRMHGEEQVVYKHPWLEEIFKETYGYPVYQEQLMFAAMKLAGYTAPEADDLRKAIAKKMREKLDTHRQKFIDGSVKNGITAETAAEVFAEWEEFARYGFNKSHAVDYGVISVQTAYLKLHFPVEYMTALLSVKKSDTAKVAVYVADARRLGVAVEPPDINSSQWDFSIEDRPDGKPVIRFGLGGVKNIGQAAVEAVLKARQDGPFDDLNNLARRVDLRQVGRRALECLAKVGALDSFGNRIAILDAVDRIVAVSSSHFRAAESGQMSLFGSHTGVVEKISLPPAKSQVGRREILNWERELIGLYVSDHPLSPVMDVLDSVVTHYSGQLSEGNQMEAVRVAGVITHVRHHQTKTGKAMAFVTIEDLQGAIELLIFPRTWEKLASIVEIDRIVLVDGKLDNAGGDPKVLVDNIATEFQRHVGESDRLAGTSTSPKYQKRMGSGHFEPGFQGDVQYDDASKTSIQTMPQLEANRDEQALNEEPNFDWDDGLPPQPETPPWDLTRPLAGPVTKSRKVSVSSQEGTQVIVRGEASSPANQTPDLGLTEDNAHLVVNSEAHVSSTSSGPMPGDPPVLSQPDESDSPVSSRTQSEDLDTLPDWDEIRYDEEEKDSLVVLESEAGNLTPMIAESRPDDPAETLLPRLAQDDMTVDRVAEPVIPPPVITPPPRRAVADSNETMRGSFLPYLISPHQSQDDETDLRMLTVVLRSTGDTTRDVLRLRRIHGIILSYPGKDRFALQVYERGRFFLLEFPNSTCGVCQEVLDRLAPLVGVENIRVEKITFQ